MAAAENKKMNCAICLSGFKKPKFLPCYHSFCLDCLKGYVRAHGNTNIIKCAVCRQEAIVPQSGVESLPNNIYCDEDPEDHLACDACSKPATHLCFECDQNFCDRCASAHMRMKVSREHRMKVFSTIDEDDIGKIKARFFCPRHPDEGVKIICKECDEFGCLLCMGTSHRTHEYEEIAKEAERMRKLLNEQILECQENVKRSEEIAFIAESRNREKHSYFKRQIDVAKRQKNQIMSFIEKNFDNFEREMERKFDSSRKLGQDICDNKNQVTENFKQSIEKAKLSMKEETDVGLLKNYDTLQHNLSQIAIVESPEATEDDLKESLEVCQNWLHDLELSNTKCKDFDEMQDDAHCFFTHRSVSSARPRPSMRSVKPARTRAAISLYYH